MTAPDFPLWSGAFAARVHELRATLGPCLHQFERLFEAWIPTGRLAQQDQGCHSRDRRWNLRLTFWTFLWQVAQAGASCREAIRQAQALCQASGRRPPPDQNSPYCQARGNLPLERLQEIHEVLMAEAEAAVASRDLWCGQRGSVGASISAYGEQIR